MGDRAMRISDEDLKLLHASWQAVLEADMKLGKARARLKMEEGAAELAHHEHNELVGRLIAKAGGRPLAHVIDMDTGELEKAPEPGRAGAERR